MTDIAVEIDQIAVDVTVDQIAVDVMVPVVGVDVTVTGGRGPTGPAGIDGTDGTDGIDGAPGQPGADGADGQQGIQGIPGEKGDKGDQGIQGVPGTPGTDGEPGADFDPNTPLHITAVGPQLTLADPLTLPSSVSVDQTGSLVVNVTQPGAQLALQVLGANAIIANGSRIYFSQQAEFYYFVSMEGGSLSGFRLQRVGEPTAPDDAATKSYVDGKTVTLPPETDAYGNTSYGEPSQPYAAGANNTAVGINTQAALTTGVGNVAIGHNAQSAPNGQADYATTTGSYQLAIGTGAGQYSANQTNHGIGIGINALYAGNGVSIGGAAKSTSSGAVAIGYNTLASGSNSVAIGYAAIANLTNQIMLGAASHRVYVNNDPVDPLEVATKGYVDSKPTGLDQATADLRYLQLTGGTISGDVEVNGELTVNGDLRHEAAVGTVQTTLTATAGDSYAFGTLEAFYDASNYAKLYGEAGDGYGYMGVEATGEAFLAANAVQLSSVIPVFVEAGRWTGTPQRITNLADAVDPTDAVNKQTLDAAVAAGGGGVLPPEADANLTVDYGTSGSLGSYNSAFGANTQVGASNSTVIGGGAASGMFVGTVALGYGSYVNQHYAIAIGMHAQALGAGAVALGTNANGIGAQAPADNSIVLGTPQHTVMVPGLMTVAADPTVPLGVATKQYVDTAVAAGGGGGSGLDQATADTLYVGKTTTGTQTMLAQLTTPQVNLGTGGNVRTTGTMLEVTGDEGMDFYVNSGSMNFWSADSIWMEAGVITVSGGQLLLAEAPTSPTAATSKQYVDTGLAAKLGNFGALEVGGGANLNLKSTGTAAMILSRAGFSNYAHFEFRTNNIQKWTVGTRAGGTEDFHFFNDITGKFPIKILATTDEVLLQADPLQAMGVATKQYTDSRIWQGTQAAYDAIVTKDPAVLYVVSG